MKKTFTFGKINYYGTRKDNLVTIDVELRDRGGEDTFTRDPKTGEKTYTGKTPIYAELSIRGNIWNRLQTDILCGGQCLDEIKKFRNQLKDKELFDELYDLWKNYHLNGMHAGTPEQEQAIEEWKAAGNRYDYTAACEMLKKRACMRLITLGYPLAVAGTTNLTAMAGDGLSESCPETCYSALATC